MRLRKSNKCSSWGYAKKEKKKKDDGYFGDRTGTGFSTSYGRKHYVSNARTKASKNRPEENCLSVIHSVMQHCPPPTEELSIDLLKSRGDAKMQLEFLIYFIQLLISSVMVGQGSCERPRTPHTKRRLCILACDAWERLPFCLTGWMIYIYRCDVALSPTLHPPG